MILYALQARGPKPEWVSVDWFSKPDDAHVEIARFQRADKKAETTTPWQYRVFPVEVSKGQCAQLAGTTRF